MVKKILSLFNQDYVHLKLEKKDATALQDDLTNYIKAIYYYCFVFLTHIIPILN